MSRVFKLSALFAFSWIVLPVLPLVVAHAEEPSVACRDGMSCLDQGWTDRERDWWYRTTQGSRLLPLDWMLALEVADSETKILSESNIRRVGYLPDAVSDSNPKGLPVGFTIDTNDSKSADLMCDRFSEMCASKAMRKPWVGLNCSACHTNDLVIGEKRLRIDGAPTLADFQGFEEDLLAALIALKAKPDKFARFSEAVLGAGASPDKKQSLTTQIDEQIAWQQKLQDKNDAPKVRYGHGRLDAQGHILNKVAMTTLLPDQLNNIRADSPASYPFIWNTSQQKKIQWNGIASNTFRLNILGNETDVGALIRNISEVVGVFAHIETDQGKAWRGYRSSANVTNLVALERQLASLQSPQWPSDLLGPLDTAKVARGRTIFDNLKCSNCHDHLDPKNVSSPMQEKMDPITEQRTDIFLACNTFFHRSKAGNFAGQKKFAYAGERIAQVDFTRNMLINTTIGTITGKLDDLLGAVFTDTMAEVPQFNQAPELAVVDFLPGVTDAAKKAMAKACLTTRVPDPKENILAYKARSLNGIWATAPYLHNGSVPSLYDLLSTTELRLRSDDPRPAPAADEPRRPETFGVGSHRFDPVKVGFVTDAADPDNRTEFRVRDPQSGEPIPGNYNSGHDYGTSKLGEAERMDLVEYLKSL